MKYKFKDNTIIHEIETETVDALGLSRTGLVRGPKQEFDHETNNQRTYGKGSNRAYDYMVTNTNALNKSKGKQPSGPLQFKVDTYDIYYYDSHTLYYMTYRYSDGEIMGYSELHGIKVDSSKTGYKIDTFFQFIHHKYK